MNEEIEALKEQERQLEEKDEQYWAVRDEKKVLEAELRKMSDMISQQAEESKQLKDALQHAQSLAKADDDEKQEKLNEFLNELAFLRQHLDELEEEERKGD